MNSFVTWLLIIFVIIAGGFATFLTLGAFSDDTSTTETDPDEIELPPATEEETEPEETPDTETPDIEEAIGVCDTYFDQTSCEADEAGLADITHPGWNESNCDSDSITCTCTWNNSTETCSLSATETDLGIIIDIAAFNLSVEFDECESGSNSTNASCEIDIEATVKNTGTETIENDFIVHFIDITNGGVGSLIEIFTVSAPFAPGEEKTFNEEYEELEYGEYFIRFIVDPVSAISETDEGNNFLTKSIDVP